MVHFTKSLRWKLQAWHALLLAIVLLVFGGVVITLHRHSQYQQIDAELHRMAVTVSNGIQPKFPRGKRGRRFSRNWPRSIRQRSALEENREPAESDKTVASQEPKVVDRSVPVVAPKPGQNLEEKNFSPFPFRKGNFPPDKANRAKMVIDFFRTRRRPDMTLSDEVIQLLESDQALQYYILLVDPEGKVMYQTEQAPDVNLPEKSSESDQPLRLVRQNGNHREVVHSLRFGSTLVLGRSIKADLLQQQKFAGFIALLGLGVLSVGLAGGWLLSARATKPIDSISRTAEAISVENLNERINLAHTDNELGRLAKVLNDAFDRLESGFEQQVRFTADASHELRTPLSVILANTEHALAKPRSSEEYREALESCRGSSQRMTKLIEALLTLARIDSGELKLKQESFQLSRVAEDCLAFVEPLARQKKIPIESQIPRITFMGDADQIAQVITNLLTNAIRYNKEQGRVYFSLLEDENNIHIRVADTGIGIATHEIPHIFDRFYRVDEARSCETGGCGLGLSICKTIVEAHGGSISVTSELNAGTTFEIQLPSDGSHANAQG